MIRLSENIKRYRLMKEMTQTQLAAVFNVSEQAVSRWENGNTYPDITLLPAIADYFGISIDELMGMETYKDEKTIDSILQTVKENERKGQISENVTLLWDAAQKYPTNYNILLYLAGQLNFEYCTDEKKSKANHEKVIDIVNRIESECNDRMICNYAINEKIIALREIDRIEEAVKIAEEQPNIWNSSNFRLLELYKGDDLYTHCRNTEMQFAQAMYWTILKYADLDFENDSFTTRDRINIAQKALDVLNVVYEGNYGVESRLVSQMNRYIEAMEVLEGNVDATLNHLEKAAEYAIIYDSLPETIYMTSTLLNGNVIKLKDSFKNFSWTECTELNKKLAQERYDVVRDTERFKNIIKKIAKYVSVPNQYRFGEAKR